MLSVIDLPHRWLSIDPGDVHVGVAWWEDATCVDVAEMNPRQALITVEELVTNNDLDALVYEKFALDPRRAGLQSGSEFATSQMIGVLKWLCEVKSKTEIEGFNNHQHKTIYRMEWYRALNLKDKRKLPWWGKGNGGDHCKDAWCVGMWLKHKRGHGQYGV